MDFITGTDGKDYSVGLGKPATFTATRDESGQVRRQFLDAGEGAPAGAIVYYRLPEPIAADAVTGTAVSIEFHDAGGNLVRDFRPKHAGYDGLSDEDKALNPGPWIPLRPGVNRFVWDLRHPGATRLRGNKTGTEASRGPLVLPGTYRVRLRVGEQTRTESFEVVNDPRSPRPSTSFGRSSTACLRYATRSRSSTPACSGSAIRAAKSSGGAAVSPDMPDTIRRSKPAMRCARRWQRSRTP